MDPRGWTTKVVQFSIQGCKRSRGPEKGAAAF
jgi:hypothetical protein